MNAVAPVRITYLTGSLRSGGAERTLVTLATRLDRTRFAPSVILFKREGPLLALIEAAGVPLDHVPLARLWSPGGARQTWRVRSHLKRTRPDLLHSFGYGADIVAAVAGRLARVPVVLTTRRSTGVDRAGQRLAYRLTNPLVHHVLAVSEASRAWSLAHEGLSGGTVTVIPNGVDTERFQPGTPESAGDGVLRVGTLGNVRPVKGLELLAEALAAVRGRIDASTRVRLLLAGRIKPDYEAPFRATLERLGVADAVELVGEVTDTPRYLRRLDVFALPSIREGMSNALLEAMATGLPVVATAVGGNVENVREGEGGFLIRDRSVPAFADALVRLVTDDATRARMGRYNRERTLSEYSLDEMVRRTERVYERLLGGVR